MRSNNCDYNKEWKDNNPGWHEVVIQIKDNNEHLKIVEWLYENIDMPERHCRWTKKFYESMFKFRYERDLIHFRLRW